MIDGSLHVGLVAPLWYPIAPDRGGIEQIVLALGRELVRSGHRVTLFASGDSAPIDRLIAVCPTGVVSAMEAGSASDYSLYEAAAVARVLEHAHELDVLHSHLGIRLVPLSTRIDVPVVHTLHTSISSDMRWILAQFPGRHITTVSRWQAASVDGFADGTVIPNGIDLDVFPFSAEADEYLLVLGRVEAAKGVHVAIDVARASGRPLVIAGPIVDSPYFADRIRPELDDRVRWVGPVGGAEKLRLLQRAHALLFPAQWDEAFGLVMVEAMACGTPVVAIERGAVAEIVIDGVNGFRADGVAALPDLVARIGELDRARVRASVTERFSHRRMAVDYVRLYRRILAGTPAQRQHPG